MDLDQLRTKQAEEKRNLLQEQDSERAPLVQKIDQLREQMDTFRLVRRSRSSEFDALRQRLYDMDAKHTDQIREMDRRHEAEIRELPSRLHEEEQRKLRLQEQEEYYHCLVQQVDTMVRGLLHEVVQIKKLQRSRVRTSFRAIGWLFAKKGSEYREVYPEVAMPSPRSWSIGGQIPDGCVTIYTVTLLERDSQKQDRFSVSARSDASYESSESRGPILEKDMRGWSTETEDLSEAQLMDALNYVMSVVDEVCPCTIRHVPTRDCPSPVSYSSCGP